MATYSSYVELKGNLLQGGDKLIFDLGGEEHFTDIVDGADGVQIYAPNIKIICDYLKHEQQYFYWTNKLKISFDGSLDSQKSFITEVILFMYNELDELNLSKIAETLFID